MGVFAPLTGVVGALQAMEAIKLLAQIGDRSTAGCCSTPKRRLAQRQVAKTPAAKSALEQEARWA